MNDDKQHLDGSINTSIIEDSRTLDTIQLDRGTLLTNEPIQQTMKESGTVVASQNTIQLADISRRADKSDLLEVDWNYKNITSKPYIIETAAFKTTSSVGQSILTMDFPNFYFTSNHVLRTVGETFLSYRGDIHLIITLQGTPLASGLLLVHAAYDPPSYAIEGPYNMFRQHAILDASDTASTVDFVVPFRHFRNSCDPFASLSKVVIEPLAPLTGIATEVYITVAAYLENHSFRFLRPLESTFKRRTQGLIDVTTVNNTLSNIESATLPTNMTGDKLDVSMMDDVAIATNPYASIVKFNSMNNTNNPHYVEKMALHPSSVQVSNFDTYNTAIDEMSLDHILKERWHYYQTYKIDPANVIPGTAILDIPLSPSIISGATTFDNFFAVTSMGRFWRGGLKFRLNFAMNRFQSMKLYLGLFYKNVAPASFVDWSSSHGVIVDVGGDSREVIVEIPYNAETPWLKITTSTYEIEHVASNDKFPNTVNDFFMGHFAVYAVSNLVSSPVNPITMVVSRQAADDFELSTYNTGYRVAQTLVLSEKSERTPGFLTDIITSMKDLTNRYSLVARAHVDETNALSKEFLWLDPNYPDYRGFVISPGTFLNAIPSGSFPISENSFGRISGLLSSHMLSYDFNSMYQGYRGSLKLRVEMAVSTVTSELTLATNKVEMSCLFINPLNATSGMNLSDISLDNINYSLSLLRGWNGNKADINSPYWIQPINDFHQDKKIFEFEIPMQTNLKWHNMRHSLDSSQTFTDLNYGLVILLFKNTADTTYLEKFPTFCSFNIYVKTGDDGRFGILQNFMPLTKETKTGLSWMLYNKDS